MGIKSLSNLDLRPGMRFAGATSVALHHALRDAARTIRTMPARYMTFPDGTPILPVRSVARQPREPATLVIDEAYLRSFGEMLVPWRVWQALQRFAVWIEPALVDEWIRLMRQYAEKQDRRLPPDRLAAAMNWSDPMRDVSLPKQRAIQVLESGKLVLRLERQRTVEGVPGDGPLLPVVGVALLRPVESDADRSESESGREASEIAKRSIDDLVPGSNHDLVGGRLRLGESGNPREVCDRSRVEPAWRATFRTGP